MQFRSRLPHTGRLTAVLEPPCLLAQYLFLKVIGNNRRRTPTITMAVLGLIFGMGSTHDVCAETPPETPDFARQILPILSDKCFVCHGPDSSNADAEAASDLRLDSFAAATRDLGGYRAIDSDHPQESELLARIESTDDPMPPADAEKSLSDSEKKLIRAWIESGGKYAEHWAFVPPSRNNQIESGMVTRQGAIDHFIGHGLKKSNTSFARPASKRILARRAALTLTGLPPEPQQLQAFLDDDSDDAYERFVDQLLESPRFGEHQARYWLDAVRYGDTHGMHLDSRRGIYPYRDWVVRAFNRNLPLDQFITWQLAGDLLSDPSHEQLLATGYVRLNPTTGEGGAISDEFQAKNNFDRVETLGTVFLGMSLTCARCHTHKYDPITQQEYYELLAFFNNTSEPALDGNRYDYGPTVRTPQNQETYERWERLSEQRDALLHQLDAKVSGSVLNEARAYAEQCGKPLVRNVRWTSPGPRTEEPPHDDDYQATDQLPGSLTGRAARGKVPGENQSTWIRLELVVPARQTIYIVCSGGSGTQVFTNASKTPLVTFGDEQPDRPLPLLFNAGTHSVCIEIVGNKGLDQLSLQLNGVWEPLLERDWGSCTAEERLAMASDLHGPLRSQIELEKELASAMDSHIVIKSLEANFTTSLIASELRQPRTTRLLRRGEYDLPVGDALQPNTLRVMGSFPADAPRNRLGLATWLTSPEHPLVSRVLVNRMWQQVYGHALVRTPEDFGLQGEQPTHPELLDWLAVELIESGWDFKRMLKLMVASRTYRQDSAYRKELDDPENRLFARGPSYRLDAEVLRDVGLWASQLLNPHMGGEGVKPYQPAGMWKAIAHPASNTKLYERDHGERLYRRSLYVYWKRTSPHPMMTLFDAPDREASCVRRSRTNTPLQSLGLLNETQRVEMARGLAVRVLRDFSDHATRVEKVFELLACRKPTPSEREQCLELLHQQLKRFQVDSEDASSLLSVGEWRAENELDIAEMAAWTQLASVILACDATITLY